MSNNLMYLVIFSVFLTGCATTDPVINTVVKYVDVPIFVPCDISVPDKPDFNFNKLTVDDTLYTKTTALLADRQLHIGYEDMLLTALKACKADVTVIK